MSDGLGPVIEKTLRQQACGIPAMLDARDRDVAGAEVVQKVGDASRSANRCDLLAANEAWPKRNVQGCENTELQASASR